MLASDTDTLTAGDFASRATWADKYRNNLHAYWDVNVVVALGQSAAAIADRLDAHLNAADLDAWTASSPRSWAMDSFDVGRRDVYALAALPTCQSGGQPVSLPPEYRRQAEKDAALQLQKAGARLAAVLNAALRAPSRRSND